MDLFFEKEKYQKRIIDTIIDKYLKVCGSICIEGPKWCGKTWTSYYHANSSFFVGDPSNNFSNRELAKISPATILQGKTPRMIDEWQEVPSIWDATRAYVDAHSQKGLIILTGSATPKRKGVLHSGAGRIVTIRMNTMSLYESGDSSGDISLKDLCNGQFESKVLKDVSLSQIAKYIVRGGWPANILNDDLDIAIIPKSYAESILNESIYNLDEEITYDQHISELLLRSLARNESTTISNASILKDIATNEHHSLSINTLEKYLEMFNRMFLFNNQRPFSPNIRSSLRVKQAEKRHFFDPAMACALLNINVDKLLSDLNTFGFLFEALVERDLAIYGQAMDAKLFHYQDYKGNEIDAILELTDGNWCAFEIKLGGNRIEEAASNLKKVCEDIILHGGKAPKIMGIIVGVYNAMYQRDDGIYVIPITALKN